MPIQFPTSTLVSPAARTILISASEREKISNSHYPKTHTWEDDGESCSPLELKFPICASCRTAWGTEGCAITRMLNQITIEERRADDAQVLNNILIDELVHFTTKTEWRRDERALTASIAIAPIALRLGGKKVVDAMLTELYKTLMSDQAKLMAGVE